MITIVAEMLLDKDTIIAVLRHGVSRIVTSDSPPDPPDTEHLYKSERHPTREFVFAVGGQGRYMSNGMLHSMSPGTLLLFDSWEPHGNGYSKFDNHLLHMWGHFFNTGLRVEILEISEAGNRLFADMLSFGIGKSIAEFITDRWDQMIRFSPKSEHEVMTFMREPVNMLLDEVAYQLYLNDSFEESESLSSRVKGYIRSRNGKKCDLTNLQNIFHVSKFHLCRKFHVETGCTIGDFIDTVRRQYVSAALRNRFLHKQIAAELGFSSTTSFRNWYQKHRQAIRETGE